MSQIAVVLKQLENTSVCDILAKMEEVYERIAMEQGDWYEKTDFTCPDGCGSCCKGFEPDIFEGEALFMAAWLLENDRSEALKVADGEFPFPHDDGTCLFFNDGSPLHCSIYNGRPFVCRLFGASSFRSQAGEKMWRPCKFYPDEYLLSHVPPLQKKQYSESETELAIGAVPPLMSDLTQEAVSLSSGDAFLIHEVLPKKLRYLLWLIAMNGNGNDNPNGTPSPAAA